jgi:methionyl-tRNA formyltransferase
MIEEARPLMRDILPSLRDGTFTRIAQKDLGPSSYFGGRRPEDGLISWEKDARSLYNLVRAVTHPYPGAFTYFEGRRLYVWWAEVESSIEIGPDKERGAILSEDPLLVNTGAGALRLVTVQLEGEKEMSGEGLAAFHRLKNGKLGGTT